MVKPWTREWETKNDFLTGTVQLGNIYLNFNIGHKSPIQSKKLNGTSLRYCYYFSIKMDIKLHHFFLCTYLFALSICGPCKWVLQLEAGIFIHWSEIINFNVQKPIRKVMCPPSLTRLLIPAKWVYFDFSIWWTAIRNVPSTSCFLSTRLDSKAVQSHTHDVPTCQGHTQL